MKAVAHIATIAVAAGVLIGLPFIAFANTGSLQAMASGVDAVSSATTIQEAPSGRYVVFINRDKHPREDVLVDWVTFFSGEGSPLIMEDVNCVALAEDPAGIEMAKSLQSRLPENQMKLRIADATLELSKADAGIYDVIVMSEELAAAYGVSELPHAEVVLR